MGSKIKIMNKINRITIKIRKNWQLKLLALGLAVAVWFYAIYR